MSQTVTTIDYKALAERLSRLADELAAFGHHTSEQRVDDLRTVASLLEGMADDEPAARIYTDAELVHRDPRWGRVCWIVPECEIDGGALLYLHPAPQPQPNPSMLESHRRLVERAIQDAERPSGMTTHDGKARIDASVLRRMLAIIDTQPPPAQPPRCGCRSCLTPVELLSTFVVCPKCGNKRCPRAEDHRNACTNSNEPGQVAQPQPERQPVSEPTEVQIEARDALLDFISENGPASEGVQHYLDRYVCAALAAKERQR